MKSEFSKLIKEVLTTMQEDIKGKDIEDSTKESLQARITDLLGMIDKLQPKGMSEDIAKLVDALTSASDEDILVLKDGVCIVHILPEGIGAHTFTGKTVHIEGSIKDLISLKNTCSCGKCKAKRHHN